MIETGTISADDKIEPRSLPRAEWSARRWHFKAGGGAAIFHKGRSAHVPSHRLHPIDRSRYPGHVLREIRARAVSFKKEPQR